MQCLIVNQTCGPEVNRTSISHCKRTEDLSKRLAPLLQVALHLASAEARQIFRLQRVVVRDGIVTDGEVPVLQILRPGTAAATFSRVFSR